MVLEWGARLACSMGATAVKELVTLVYATLCVCNQYQSLAQRIPALCRSCQCSSVHPLLVASSRSLQNDIRIMSPLIRGSGGVNPLIIRILGYDSSDPNAFTADVPIAPQNLSAYSERHGAWRPVDAIPPTGIRPSLALITQLIKGHIDGTISVVLPSS